MSAEKPLHVQVAAALGWTDLVVVGIPPLGIHWVGAPPIGQANHTTASQIDLEERVVAFAATTPRFDEEWSVTGPLIGRFKIRVSYSSLGHPFADHPSVDSEHQQPGERDILPAICRVILALHEKGRLG